MKYADIKDMESLDEAIRGLSGEIAGKGREVMYRYDEMKEAYSPAGLIAAGLKHISGSIPFDRIVLAGIRFLRDRILR